MEKEKVLNVLVSNVNYSKMGDLVDQDIKEKKQSTIFAVNFKSLYLIIQNGFLVYVVAFNLVFIFKRYGF